MGHLRALLWRGWWAGINTNFALIAIKWHVGALLHLRLRKNFGALSKRQLLFGHWLEIQGDLVFAAGARYRGAKPDKSMVRANALILKPAG